jgi:hypothetical protein
MKITRVLIVLAFAGCVATGTQVKDSALTQFQKGVTTETDVERALGPPTSTTMSSDGTRSMSYSGVHAQPKAASFIPVVGLFAGGASSQVSMVTLRFGQDGKLLD